MEQTIIALATPPLKAALAVIRVSGEDSITITDSLFSKSLENITKRQIFTGYFLDNDGKQIDQVVLLVFPAPNSFTGENVVEIICHGSQLIVEEIVKTYLQNGVRYAKHGEFTERAFLNKKIDLVESESINDLINASTKEGKDLALLSLKGDTSKLLSPIKIKLEELLAMIEVNIDFPEFEDVEEATPDTVNHHVEEIIETIDLLINNGLQGKVIKEGISIAIVGEPNVGKSSILNALLKEDKAIVTSIPGTTRDIVEGYMNIKGIPVKLLDTAGVRDTEDVVEKIGVSLSTKSIDEADLVIYVLDASNPVENKEITDHLTNKKVIRCFNKSDLTNNTYINKVYTNALNKDVNQLKEAIYNSLNIDQEAFDRPALTNERQISLLTSVKKDLLDAKMTVDSGLTVDAIAISIQSSYLKIKEILGEEVVVDLEDAIFSHFCVGK